jgi:hypothetical protein
MLLIPLQIEIKIIIQVIANPIKTLQLIPTHVNVQFPNLENP